MVSAIVVAAGKGQRMGAGINKVYLSICGRTILEVALSALAECDKISEIIVVTDDVEQCRAVVGNMPKVKEIVLGGATRRESVKNGLCRASGELVAIHDGARALVTALEIEKVIAAAGKYGAAALGVKCKDTIKRADREGFIAETPDRSFLYQIQTPQVFRREEIIKAHEAAEGEFTDDCAVMEQFGKKVKIVEGSYENIKITTPEDLAIAEKILEKRHMK